MQITFHIIRLESQYHIWLPSHHIVRQQSVDTIHRTRKQEPTILQTKKRMQYGFNNVNIFCWYIIKPVKYKVQVFIFVLTYLTQFVEALSKLRFRFFWI